MSKIQWHISDGFLEGYVSNKNRSYRVYTQLNAQFRAVATGVGVEAYEDEEELVSSDLRHCLDFCDLIEATLASKDA